MPNTPEGYRLVVLPDCCYTCESYGLTVVSPLSNPSSVTASEYCILYNADVQADGLCDDFKRSSSKPKLI